MLNYTITHEPLKREDEEHLPASMDDELEDFFYRIKKGKASVKKKLEKLIKRFPNVPVLLNHLVIWYNANGDTENARRINEDAYKKFPNYLFAITNKVSFDIEDGDLEEIKKLLGDEPFDISNLYPNRNIFHFTEYQAYSSAAIQYLAAANRTEEAWSYLENLYTDNVTKDFFNAMRSLIGRYELKFADERWQAAQEKEKLKSANERQEPTIMQADEALAPKNLRYAYLYAPGLWEIDFEQLEKDIGGPG